MVNYLRKSSIPEKIEFLYFEEREILLNGKRVNVIPAMQSNPKNPLSKSRVTSSKFFNNFLKEKSFSDIKSEIVDNTSLKDIQVITLHSREHIKGGNVIKCIITYGDKKFLVDMKENMFFEAVYANGMKRGAKLNGEFIWAEEFFQKNRYLRLIRINSERYNDSFKLKNNLKLPPISKKILKEGKVYYSRNHTKYLFCGFVDVTKYKISKDFHRTIDKIGNLKKSSKLALFYKLSHNEIIDFEKYDLKNFHLVKNHTMIGKTNEELKISSNLFSDIRNTVRDQIKDLLIKYCHMDKKTQYYSSHNEEYNLCDYIKKYNNFINMNKYKEENQKIFDFKTLLTFE